MPRLLKPTNTPLHILTVLTALLLFLAPLRADQSKEPKKPISVPEAFTKTAPENVDDLKAMETHVKALLEKVMPCTVCVRVGNASGSGVIVSEDGIILTAAHVSGKPDQDVQIVFSDGKTIKGKTLGRNTGIDSGMIKITEEGTTKWPFIEMGDSSKLVKGQWVLTTGHPGGFQKGRTPPVRLGRVIETNNKVIRTECTLFGGDSGGPLFDMEGKVVGIHSRIAGSLTTNFHVPVDTFRETWDRLVKGEAWGGPIGTSDEPKKPADAWLGVQADPDKEECRVTKVVPQSPADKAGLKADDVIVKFGGGKVETFEDLQILLRRKKAGEEVAIEVLRDGKNVTLKVTLAEKVGSDK